MALRFHKSIKICKGVKVNFSKSGPSLSLGGTGHSVNFGKRGTMVTYGIPGTGISWREQINGSSRNAMNSKAHIAGRVELPSRVALSLDSEGKPVFVDSNDCLITDPAIIRKLKAIPQIKEQIERLDGERIKKNMQIIAEQRENMQNFLNLHRLSPKVMTRMEWSDEYDNLEQQHYEMRLFSEPKPDYVEVEKALRIEAENNVKTHAFWKVKKLHEDYVSEHLPKRIQQLESAWQAAKEEFEANEERTAEQANAEFRRQYQETREALEKLIKGVPEFVEAAIDEWFTGCTLPVEIDICYVYNADNGSVLIDMDLPEIEDIPDTEYTQLANGNIKEKKQNQTVLRQEYAILVFGLAIFVSANVFNVSPAIESILLSGYTQRRDTAGSMNDDYIYSIKFSRSVFENSRLQEANPLDFCLQFENRCKMTSTQLFKTIVPFDSNAE